MTLATRRRLGLIVALILAAACWAAPSIARASVTTSAAATVHPRNVWDGDEQYFVNEGHASDCARLGPAKSGYSDGALIIGSGDCTNFVGVIYSDGTYQLELYRNQGQCLFWDKTGTRDGYANSFDLDTCSSSTLADIWGTTGASGYTQWYTLDNSADSMWARTGVGTGYPTFAGTQNGTDARDHWVANNCTSC